MQNDASYKRLYAHAELVTDLLRSCVREPWVGELDFTTLERVNGSHVDQSRFLVTRSRDRRHRRRKKTRPSDVP